MAIVSSHTLNAVDGTHAGGITVELARFESNGARTTILETATDQGGRLSESVPISPEDSGAQYELVFRTGDYFAKLAHSGGDRRICREVVIRFSMPDPDGSYHIPMILAPNGYSVWWSN